mmetsp:Transcript_53154/g.104051  ORF Transcript_53154/g.104051 Transcript_53154/m.104051 type:complete len:186 (+) Transcript_53154:1640-2197(+)
MGSSTYSSPFLLFPHTTSTLSPSADMAPITLDSPGISTGAASALGLTSADSSDGDGAAKRGVTCFLHSDKKEETALPLQWRPTLAKGALRKASPVCLLSRVPPNLKAEKKNAENKTQARGISFLQTVIPSRAKKKSFQAAQGTQPYRGSLQARRDTLKDKKVGGFTPNRFTFTTYEDEFPLANIC